MAKKATPAVQSPATSVPALASHLVFIDHTTSIDIDDVFHGDYSPITADRFNSARDLLEAVKFQWLNDKAQIATDVGDFKLKDAEKQAYMKLFTLRASYGFDAGSQAKFAGFMRAAQNFYAHGCKRTHEISLGNLVSAVAAYTVQQGLKVHSSLESSAKRFVETKEENKKAGNGASVFKPAEPAKTGADKKPKASKIDLTPSESDLVEAASKQVKALLKCGNLTEMLAKLEEIDKLLSKVVQQHAE